MSDGVRGPSGPVRGVGGLYALGGFGCFLLRSSRRLNLSFWFLLSDGLVEGATSRARLSHHRGWYHICIVGSHRLISALFHNSVNISNLFTHFVSSF